jgi:hypothetical protein
MEGSCEIILRLITAFLMLPFIILVSIKIVNDARKDSGYEETLKQLMEEPKKKK